MRIDQGMAGYTTDDEVRRWRHHEPQPTAFDYAKAACGIALAAFAFWLVMWAIELTVGY